MLITNTSTALTKPKCLKCQGHLRILLSREQESNLQPADYKSAALPIELSRHRQENFNGSKLTGISHVGRISIYPLLLTYLMYPHHPSVATPISPMEFLCPSWVFKRKAISLYLRRDSNSHSRRNLILSQAGLPIPPLRLSCDDGGNRTHDTRIISQAILLLVSIFCKHCRVRRSTAELHRHR